MTTSFIGIVIGVSRICVPERPGYKNPVCPNDWFWQEENYYCSKNRGGHASTCHGDKPNKCTVGKSTQWSVFLSSRLKDVVLTRSCSITTLALTSRLTRTIADLAILAARNQRPARRASVLLNVRVLRQIHVMDNGTSNRSDSSEC